MINFFFKKYRIGLLVTALYILIGLATEGNFNDGMFLASCLGVLTYLICLIVFAQKGSGKKAITMIEAVINIFKFIWYVISLKPLRRWISRLRLYGLSPKPYPYLALFGGVADTQAMMANYTSAFWFDKTPAVRASLWRLFSRKVLKYGPGTNGGIAIKLGEWNTSPSDGADQTLERTLYRFLSQIKSPDGSIDPKRLFRVISFDGIKKKGEQSYDTTNQFRFAEILSTSISKHDYSDREKRNIYGMRKFLEDLPSSFEQLTGNASQLDLQRIWSEYMAFAYLFGIEQNTLHRLAEMIPESSQPPLLYLLSSSEKHRSLLQQLMNSASDATRYADDAVSATRGRLKEAWHADEVYDISTN